jgi:PAS domain S-box-containing protein
MNPEIPVKANETKIKLSGNDYTGKSIAETIVNGFFTVDQKWIVQYWNKAAEKILKVRAADIVGKSLWESFADFIPLEFYAVYHKAFENDMPVHFEEYWGEMGAWFDVVTYYCDNVLSVSFKSSNQSVDPDYPKNREQQLKIKTELYRFVTEVTNDCLWEWDLVTKEIFWVDGGHKRVFGYQVENALIPQSFWESRVHPEDRTRILSRLDRIIKEKAVCTWEDEYRFKRANGQYASVRDRGHIIFEGDDTCRMIGATQDITEHFLLEKKLIDERAKMQKEITEAVLTAQESERAEIGKELHDNINQILGATKLYIEMAKTEETREIFLEKASGHIMNVIEEIRRISKKLVPQSINLIGLGNSIKILIDDLTLVHPVRIEFIDSGIDKDGLDDSLQLNIFRIVQEQVNNILKHSDATQARIHLAKDENAVVLLVSDNGKGCDSAVKSKGVGIRNIISRVELYDGSVTIVSNPGEGYELNVQLPLKPGKSFYK